MSKMVAKQQKPQRVSTPLVNTFASERKVTRKQKQGRNSANRTANKLRKLLNKKLAILSQESHDTGEPLHTDLTLPESRRKAHLTRYGEMACNGLMVVWKIQGELLSRVESNF